MRRPFRILGIAISAAVLGVGSVLTLSTSSAVSLVEDGEKSLVWGYAPTISTLLADEGITVGAKDLVSPAVDGPVVSGSTIEVKHHREIRLTVDGEKRDILTTEPTLAAALAAAKLPDYADSRINLDRHTLLPPGFVNVHVTTPKKVTIFDGSNTVSLTSTAPDVATLLAESGHVLGGDTYSFPESKATVTEGLTVAVGKIETSTKTRTETIPFTTEQTKSSELFQGETRVMQRGKEGSVERAYTTVKVNGTKFLTHVTKETVTAKPVAHRIANGTKIAGVSGKGIDLRREAQWIRIAQCESGNRWSINTGNGYFGGLQFNNQSWTSNGGRDFAPRADLATREQQITVANRYADRAGFRPWSCKP